MSQQEFKSNQFAAWNYQIGPAFLGGLMVLGAPIALSRGASWPTAILVMGWGVYNLAFVMRTWGKFGSVTADLKGVSVGQGGSKYRFAWRQVQECTKVRNGPLLWWWQQRIYRLTFNEPPLVTYFVPLPTAPEPLDLWGPHFEGMLDLIRQKSGQARGA
jgi:hypothetical protein